MLRCCSTVMIGLALVAVACSADERVGAPAEATTTTTATAPRPTNDTWVELLSSVPDQDSYRLGASMVDLAEGAAVRGVEPPEPGSSVEEYTEFIVALDQGTSEDDPFVGLQPTSRTLAFSDVETDEMSGFELMRAEIGWTYTDADAYMEVGVEQSRLEVVLGDFDPDAISAALDAVPYWSDRQEVVEHEGVQYYRWDDDGKVDREHISAARPLGIGGRMAVYPDRILWTDTDAAMEAAIEATGDGRSLADDEAVGPLAEALGRSGAFVAMFTNQVGDGTDGEAMVGATAEREFIEQYEQEVADGQHHLLVGVEAWGSSWGLDAEDEPFTVLALGAVDSESAAANEALFRARWDSEESYLTRQPFAEVGQIAESDVDGTVTTFLIDMDHPRFFLNALFRRDWIIANGTP
jgi:hypothetical protein